MNRDGSLTLLYSLYRENIYIKCKMGVVRMHSAYARKTCVRLGYLRSVSECLKGF